MTRPAQPAPPPPHDGGGHRDERGNGGGRRNGSGDRRGDGGPRLPVTVHIDALAADHGRVYAAGHDMTVVQQPPAPAPPTATRTLLRAETEFTGRRAEVDRIVASAGSAGAEGGPGVVRVCAVDGMPGVGKTTLVNHVAALLADRYPDGQHFVRLHAHDLGRGPADPAAVLATLLVDGLGLEARFLPETLEGRAGLWRDRLDGRRVVLVLDDAADAEQVEPLLPGPGAGRCLVLVTSRRRLPGLNATDVIDLGVLPEDDAALLFTRLIRRPPAAEPERREADRAATAEIVRLCGRLPLAVALLAGRIATHTEWDLSEYAAVFEDTRDRLAELAHGDRAVAAAFEMSYRGLTPALRRMFRRLGLHPGPDVDVYAAAALAGVSPAVARAQTEALYAAHLVTAPERTPASPAAAIGRCRLHDLLRAYARTLALRHDPPRARAQAVGRLLDRYRHTAEAADVFLRRLPHPRPHLTRPAASPGPALPDRGAALAWLRTERPNIGACLDHAGADHPDRLIRTADALATFLRLDGQWPDATRLHRMAHDAARRAGDRPGQADALYELGWVRLLTDDYRTAAELLEQAQDLYDDLGDRTGRANTLHQLGRARMMAGDYPAAAALLEQAQALYDGLGSRSGLANALFERGQVLLTGDDYLSAADLLERSRHLYDDLGDRLGLAYALQRLGLLALTTEDRVRAADLLAQAQDLYDDLGDRLGQANNLHEQGRVRIATGDHAAAADLLERAHGLFAGLGSRLGQANILHELGRLESASGAYPAARDLLERAQRLYDDIGDRLGQANNLHELGRTRTATGEHAAAADMLRRALELYEGIGSRQGQAGSLSVLGQVRLAAGDPAEAGELFGRALDLYTGLGNRLGVAGALHLLGQARMAGADHPAAGDLLRRALEAYEELGNAHGQAEVLNSTGILLTVSARLAQAREAFRGARAAARAAGSPIDEARALQGAAHVLGEIGDRGAAVAAMQEAAALYAQAGSPEAEAARAMLAQAAAQGWTAGAGAQEDA